MCLVSQLANRRKMDKYAQPMTLPPDKQPTGGWKLKLSETGGVVVGEDFASFVKAVNDQLSANGFQRLSQEAILERMRGAGA